MKSKAIFLVLCTSVLITSALGGLLVARMAQLRRTSNQQVVSQKLDGTARNASEPLPRFQELPEFKLLTETGEPFTRAQLLGKITIANFIFTRCPMVCPLLSQQMAGLGADISKLDPTQTKVLRISVSVDPDYDKPAVMAAYKRRFDQGAAFWRFLTGERPNITSLIRDGFKLALPTEDGGGVIIHSESFALIDRQAVVRGYYKIAEPSEKARLLFDAQTLLRRGDLLNATLERNR